MPEITSVQIGIPGPAGSGVSAAQYAALLATDVTNTAVFSTNAQETSDTASTTSTATYSTAQTRTVTLGTGTWTVSLLAFIDCKHSASSNVDVRTNIDGTDGTSIRINVEDSVIYHRIVVSQVQASVSGGRTITTLLQFKSGSAGTTSARNPAVRIIAFRTA